MPERDPARKYLGALLDMRLGRVWDPVTYRTVRQGVRYDFLPQEQAIEAYREGFGIWCTSVSMDPKLRRVAKASKDILRDVRLF